MRLKTKIWIENENKNLILGSGRLQILKDLMKTNNIKITAKNLNMNYRKCWGKINDINKNFGKNLIISKAGKFGGGTYLTQECTEILTKFDMLQKDIKEFSQKRFEEIFLNFD